MGRTRRSASTDWRANTTGTGQASVVVTWPHPSRREIRECELIWEGKYDKDGRKTEFANGLCSAVLMHLPREHLSPAVLTLARILKPGGRLVISCRESRSGNEREPDGRLFTPIPPGELTLLLEAAGFQVLLSTRQQDSARSKVGWKVLAAEKQSAGRR